MITKRLVSKVTELLKAYPDLRDDDDYLVSMVWRSEIGENNHSESCFVLLGKIARKEVSKAESIRRTRQKIQEKVPVLRGKLWGKRHKKADNYPQEELKALDEIINKQGDLFE